MSYKSPILVTLNACFEASPTFVFAYAGNRRRRRR